MRNEGECHKGEGAYFIGDGVEEGVHDPLREATLLVFVHGDHLAPISRHFGKVETLGKVDEVEDVLLETRPAKPDRRPQKLGPNASILAHSIRDLLNVGPRRLTNGRERVNGRNSLCQHCVGGQFRQLRRPEANGQDAISPAFFHTRASGQAHMKRCDVLNSRNPVCVNIGQGLACTFALRRLQRPNQHSIRVEQIADSCALREELGVGKYVKADARFRVGLENGAHRLRRTHWYCGLLDDNLGSCRDGGDAACGGFDITGYYCGDESVMCCCCTFQAPQKKCFIFFRAEGGLLGIGACVATGKIMPPKRAMESCAQRLLSAPRKRQRKKSIHDDEKKGEKHELEVGSKASTNTSLLCGGVDADENEVCLLDGAVYVRGERQVATTCLFDNIVEARFIYR